MGTKTPTQLVEEWFERVWNRGEEGAIHELMAPDCEAKGLDLPEKGPGGFLAFHRTFRNAFDSIRVEVIEALEQGERTIGHARFTAVHKPTGNPIDVVFSYSSLWRGGQLCETRNVVDYTALLSQMNAFDKQALADAFEA